jgi:DNA-binding FadR family transcriptional regulator
MVTEQRVLHLLLERIQDREWAVGERLPSERTLAEELSASRATVRGALRQLLAQGLVEIRGGSGCYLRSSNLPPARPQAPENPGDGLVHLEACYHLLAPVAALCARRAAPEHLADLDECAIGLSRAILDRNQQGLADEALRFPRVLAQGAGNADLEYLVGKACARTLPVLRHFFAISEESHWEALFAGQMRVTQAVKTRDSLGARQRMEESVLRLALMLEKITGTKVPEYLRDEARARSVTA